MVKELNEAEKRYACRSNADRFQVKWLGSVLRLSVLGSLRGVQGLEPIASGFKVSDPIFRLQLGS